MWLCSQSNDFQATFWAALIDKKRVEYIALCLESRIIESCVRDSFIRANDYSSVHHASTGERSSLVFTTVRVLFRATSSRSMLVLLSIKVDRDEEQLRPPYPFLAVERWQETRTENDRSLDKGGRGRVRWIGGGDEEETKRGNEKAWDRKRCKGRESERERETGGAPINTHGQPRSNA